MMTKILYSGIFAATIAATSASVSQTQDAGTPAYRIGDRMPNHTNGIIQPLIRDWWTDDSKGNDCEGLMTLVKNTDNQFFKMLYAGQWGDGLPYLIYDMSKKIFYVDNKKEDGSKGMDGKIDSIIPYGPRSYTEDHPFCAKTKDKK